MGGTVWTMNQFSWENKYVGVQIKATKVQFSYHVWCVGNAVAFGWESWTICTHI
jgi:hypothetical protein